jgi:hypothetical protein
MKARSDAACLQNVDVRLSRADSIRENFWLDKIESVPRDGHVLIICGYLHVDFLASSVSTRGGRVVKKCTYPTNLLGVMPTITFSPDKLREYLQEQGS